jgi:K+-sensing histidine kinase KdpD
MSSTVLSPRLLTSERPSRAMGVLAAAGSVAVATGLIYPLRQVSPVVSLGVLYVLAVVVISTFWGLAFGIGTSVLSAGAFNFFHLPPGGRFDLADERDWVALLVFVIVAVTTGLVADLEEEEAQGRSVLESARIVAHRAGIKIHTALIRTRNPGAALVDEARRVGADVIYWSTIHAPAGEQGIGPTAAYLLRQRPCRVIIETEKRHARTREGEVAVA